MVQYLDDCMLMNQNCDAARETGIDTVPGVPGLACQLSGDDAGTSTGQGSGYQRLLHRDDALTYHDGKSVSW